MVDLGKYPPIYLDGLLRVIHRHLQSNKLNTLSYHTKLWHSDFKILKLLRIGMQYSYCTYEKAHYITY